MLVLKVSEGAADIRVPFGTVRWLTVIQTTAAMTSV